MAESRRLRIGVSRCLLGDPVRFDGGHKKSPFLVDMLSRYADWVPVCPEVEAGLGTPREPVRLTGRPEAPRVLGTRSGTDHTPALIEASRRQGDRLAAIDLDGFVLKKGSPSCGMERVKIFPGGPVPSYDGVGVFALELRGRFPLLPMEEEGRLTDSVLRENFLDRVLAFRRWKDFLEEPFTVGRLVAFHTAEKFLLLSHSPERYRELGRIVAAAKALGPETATARYGQAFMEAMAERSTRKRHTNVLHHLAGFLRRELDAAGRREIGDLIDDYRNGIVPLAVPMAVIRHHVRVLDQSYLRGQVYLDPHPRELGIRSHV